MNCPRVNRNGKPAGWLHSLCCAECRGSKRTDDLLAFGIVQLRKQANAPSALNRTLAALALPPVAENYGLLLERRSRNRVRLAVGGALFLCIAGWFGYMDWTPPAIPSPSSMEPSPAYLALMQAAPVQSADSRQAARINAISTVIRKMNTGHETVSDQEREALHRFLVDGESCIKTVHANLLKPYQENMDPSSQEIHYGYIHLYSIVLTLEADGVWRASQRDREGAIDAALNMIAFGENIAGGGTWLARAYGNLLQGDGRRLLWRYLPDMTEEEAQQASRRMEEACKRHTSPLFSAQWEHAANLRINREMLLVPFWRIRQGDQFTKPTLYPGETLSRIYVTFKLYTRSNRTILRELSEAQKASEQQFEYPYVPNRNPVEVLQDPLDQELQPDETNILRMRRFQDMASETQNALLTTALAIRAYHQAYRADPATLQALCPQYLEKVPADPFHPQTSLQYAALQSKFHSFVGGSAVGRVDPNARLRSATSSKAPLRGSTIGPGETLSGTMATLPYILYSVGPDGCDQQGAFIDQQPLASPESNVRDRYRVQEASQGDIVAGLNL